MKLELLLMVELDIVKELARSLQYGKLMERTFKAGSECHWQGTSILFNLVWS